MSDLITSARVRELIEQCEREGWGVFGVTLGDNADHIAKALDLWEKVQGGDAGLVDRVGRAIMGSRCCYVPYETDPVHEDDRHMALAALAALVGEG
jgi:hypothetical protein